MAMVILGLHESLGAWEMIRSSYPHAQSLRWRRWWVIVLCYDVVSYPLPVDVAVADRWSMVDGRGSRSYISICCRGGLR